MKSTFAVACFVAINSANASFFEDAKQFFAELPVTRQDAMKKAGTTSFTHRATTLTQ